jgi:NosR/NirI family transcriptional regulator, nitrous oxide reductase regulator
MRCSSGLFQRLLTAVVLLAGFSLNASASYEAPLPARLSTDPDLCAFVACQDVLPGADSFSHRKGRPAYVEAYRTENGAQQLIGYVFLSTDIVDIPAYSGKPVVTLLGMDTQGIIAGVKILRHSEPILLLGIPEEELTKFVKQYLGQFVGAKIDVGKSRPDQGIIGMDAISGATVTVIAQNQVILRSGMEIAKQVGIIEPTIRPQAKFTRVDAPRDWAALVKEGSVRQLRVRAEDVGLARGEQPYIDIHFGYLNAPAAGRALLGDAGHARLMSRLGENDHAIFLIADGIESFKGSGFVRGGIYDRILVSQDMDTVTFRDLDYLPLWGIEAAGVPDYRESAIFIVRSPAFSAAYPWKLVFLANTMDRQTGARTFSSFDSEYWVPAKYLEGGRPKRMEAEAPWVRIWKTRALEIALFTALLLGVGTVYAFRERLTRRATRHNKWPVNSFKYAAWVISIGFVGFYLMAQPSITQVLTWFHALLFQWKWELFLTDPFIFLFWIFIIVTVFVWGRGLFCGWLCPFGSLTEILYKIGGAVGLKRWQFALPMRWHNRLKWGKYVAFFVLLATSLLSMGLAERLAEIEPFKTTFLVGMFNRAWPYTLFVAALFGLSIFMERPFCKYLCPLGAALAMPSTFRWYGLKRKQECDTCKACAVGCGSLAIDEHGRIDHRECLHCLDCMILYTDVHACPPLSKERKRRERAGLPLTPIDDAGYFIPIKAVPFDAPAAKAQAD